MLHPRRDEWGAMGRSHSREDGVRDNTAGLVDVEALLALRHHTVDRCQLILELSFIYVWASLILVCDYG